MTLDLFRLEGRRALVTGSSLGHAIARRRHPRAAKADSATARRRGQTPFRSGSMCGIRTRKEALSIARVAGFHKRLENVERSRLDVVAEEKPLALRELLDGRDEPPQELIVGLYGGAGAAGVVGQGAPSKKNRLGAPPPRPPVPKSTGLFKR